jgi:hypothetical protein
MSCVHGRQESHQAAATRAERRRLIHAATRAHRWRRPQDRNAAAAAVGDDGDGGSAVARRLFTTRPAAAADLPSAALLRSWGSVRGLFMDGPVRVAWEKEGGGFSQKSTSNFVLRGRASLQYLRRPLISRWTSRVGFVHLCTSYALCTRYGPVFQTKNETGSVRYAKHGTELFHSKNLEWNIPFNLVAQPNTPLEREGNVESLDSRERRVKEGSAAARAA